MSSLSIMITSPLEDELVARIGDHRPGLRILHDAALLPAPRYPCDHRGDPRFRRDAAGQRRWLGMLAQAEVLFGIPGDSAAGLAAAVRDAPALRWIQATSAGAGEIVRASELDQAALRRVQITTASGVHAAPLAEFAFLGALAFTKDLPRLARDKAARAWPHHPVAQLRGRTLLVVGYGSIGVEVARMARGFGMTVFAVRRRPDAPNPLPDVEVHPLDELPALVSGADVVVLALPGTRETQQVLDRELITGLKPGAVVVNVGRGSAIDEPALAEALASERIAGAALDVFAAEPLPDDSPLWRLENVILSPHTAALTIEENARIVELFLDNVDRFVDGRPLRNAVDRTAYY